MADWGRYYHQERVILLREGLTQAEERAVLWHELTHARRGDRRCAPGVLTARQEASVDREAARWALPLPAVLYAASCCRGADEGAELLETTPRLLTGRLHSLHPSERAALAQVVSARDPAP